MTTHTFTRCLAAALFFTVAIFHAEAAPKNVIIVLADDLGFGDLACYGNEIVHTPHLDRFAKEGLKFTSYYAPAANCSPSRAGLMTGRTPWRLGVHNWIPMLSPMHVRESEITIATLLREKAGYATCHSGKWHLNGNFNLPGQPQPDDHGFDHWFSTQNNALPNHKNPWNFVRNDFPVGPLEGYAAHLVVDEAITWLRAETENARDLEKPFFLFVCLHEPHEPVASAERFTRLYADLEDPAERALWGNITQMDDAFGQLMTEVDSLRLRDDTVVFFTSDNGPALTGKHPYGSAGPLRAKKGYLWEGGIRVPGILRWPGKTKPGSESDEPVCGVDWLPTLCEMAGIEPPDDRKLDGASWIPYLDGKTESVARTTPLYWQFFRARGEAKVAIRDGDWKMTARFEGEDLKPSANITPEEIDLYRNAELTGFQLFNLKKDIAESIDLAEKEPAQFESMKSALLKKYHEVRDESPSWPEWEWPRYEGHRIEWPEYKALRRPPTYE
ncbi:MAG: sulfatase-like hydrolase/transferase [Verrucomicrobiales bacterium]|nr:sulfatase-like hydrolase/transferase [Verrucomicrobiales bacterium]